LKFFQTLLPHQQLSQFRTFYNLITFLDLKSLRIIANSPRVKKGEWCSEYFRSFDKQWSLFREKYLKSTQI